LSAQAVAKKFGVCPCCAQPMPGDYRWLDTDPLHLEDWTAADVAHLPAKLAEWRKNRAERDALARKQHGDKDLQR